MRAIRLAPLAVLAGAAGSFGCGGGPRVAEVEGTVRVGGKPAEKIQVEFWPTTDGPRSIGVTDGEGRFTLTTDDGRKGAVVGAHKVVLRDVGIMGDKFLGRAGETVDMTKGRPPRVPKVYADVAKTTLEKTVTAGPNRIDIAP